MYFSNKASSPKTEKFGDPINAWFGFIFKLLFQFVDGTKLQFNNYVKILQVNRVVMSA